MVQSGFKWVHPHLDLLHREEDGVRVVKHVACQLWEVGVADPILWNEHKSFRNNREMAV